MITLKTAEEIEILREGGRRHAAILREVAAAARPGVLASDLNSMAEKLISEGGDSAAFLNYTPAGASRPYPASLCVSVNDEIVHGIPNEGEKILKEGDVVSLDLGLKHQGLVTDSAVTVPVGKIDAVAARLIEVTKRALEEGIAAIRAGGYIGDIGAAIKKIVKGTGFSLAEGLSGHGVGYSVHEDPYVPNTGVKGKGAKLSHGLVIAIEPMVCEGRGEIVLADDGFTYKTADGGRSAHFEHTVVITEEGPEILTKV